MTLRSRLLLLLVGIVLVGLLVSGIITYKSLESFLVSRLNQQLTSSAQPLGESVFRCLERSNDNSSNGICYLGGNAPSVPSGTFAQLQSGGSQYNLWFFSHSAGNANVPVLSGKHPFSTSRNWQIFEVSSKSGLDYHAIKIDAAALPNGLSGTLFIAVPLTEVDGTLNRLLLVELLVSACVLLFLGALSWWIVKAGLKPLDDMTETAGAIAAGDLTQRVPVSDGGTEVDRLGEAFNVMLGEIEKAFAARTASEERLRRFLADASHELRTPLTSIRGYAEMFDRGARDRPEDLATSMRYIKADADRMSSLVEDLMLIARLDRERPLEHEQLDLRDVLEPAVSAIRVRDTGRTVTLTASGPGTVVGDPDRLRQVVDNLLVNAVRHTPAGTAIEAKLSSVDGDALVEVRDHGGGISEEDRKRVFEPFFRADPSRNRATGGQGLGLAIVATIVEAHGGEVGVENAAGGGARFWFKLPLAGAARSPEVTPSGGSATAGSNGDSDRSNTGAPGAVDGLPTWPPTPRVGREAKVGTVPVVGPDK